MIPWYNGCILDEDTTMKIYTNKLGQRIIKNFHFGQTYYVLIFDHCKTYFTDCDASNHFNTKKMQREIKENTKLMTKVFKDFKAGLTKTLPNWE
jgi:hypothetical protein